MTTSTETKATATTTKATSAPKAKAKQRAKAKAYNYIGKFFASFRVHQELTTEAWAKLVGVSSQYISKIERGEVELTVDQAQKLMKALSAFPEYVPQFIELVAYETNVVLIDTLPVEIKNQIVDLAVGRLVLSNTSNGSTPVTA